MPDIFLYSGEASPNDIRLSDPSVLRGGGGSVKDGGAAVNSASTWGAAATARRTGAGAMNPVSTWAATAGAIQTGAAALNSVSTWSATAGARRTGAASLASVSTWGATGTQLTPGGSVKNAGAALNSVSAWTATGTVMVLNDAGLVRWVPLPTRVIKPARAHCAGRWTWTARASRVRSSGGTMESAVANSARGTRRPGAPIEELVLILALDA